MKWLKDLILDKFLKSYLGDLIKRLDGYKFFLGLTLSILQIANQMAGGKVPFLETVVEVINGTGTVEAVLQPDDIGILATSLWAIYGLIMKAVKLYKGVPQVPMLIIKK